MESLLTALVLLRSLVAFARALRKLTGAEHVLLVVEGGFGHTIMAPDMFRRLHAGKRLACVILRRESQNPHSALLFPDVPTVFLPLDVRLPSPRGRSEWTVSTRNRERFARVLAAILRRAGGVQATSTSSELYRQVARIHAVKGPPFAAQNGFIVGWAELIGRVDAPRARLPPQFRQKVAMALEAYTGAMGARKLCCLYLRARGAGAEYAWQVDLQTRLAGPFEGYVPALRHLVEQGYLVLLTGEVRPPPEIAASFGRALLWPELLDVDPGLTSLYAATEADVWIGNTGGGAMVPAANRTPMLVVDAFPYAWGLPFARVCYKTLHDDQGRPLSWARALAEHAFSRDLGGLTLRNNDPELLLEAVREFVADPRGALHDAVSWCALRDLPDHVFDKHTHTALSHAWLRRFGPLPRVRPEDAHEASWPRPCCERGQELRLRAREHAFRPAAMAAPAGAN